MLRLLFVSRTTVSPPFSSALTTFSRLRIIPCATIVSSESVMACAAF
ncbi:hypothetical protein ACMZKS_26160 [Citrobacter freundii]|nr:MULTISPECIES: hypothetical protein [Enterobacteriaceae]WRR55444.1 hypothetical protein U9I37_28465 [Citrobacter freundii]